MIPDDENDMTPQDINRLQGSLLIRLRAGEELPLLSHNPYLFEAVKLRDLVYTLPELERIFTRPLQVNDKERNLCDNHLENFTDPPMKGTEVVHHPLFNDPSLPLVLEVGCYMGHTVKELAEYNPGINVLGLDIKYKRVVKSSEKIKNAGLSNAKIAICDVMDLLPILPGHSVFGMFIFFPDPWIKSRHEKFRFLNEDFFTMASSRLSAGGFIWLKTDQKRYFDEIIASARQYDFSVGDELPGIIARREYRTKFEDTFTSQKIPFYQVILHLIPGVKLATKTRRHQDTKKKSIVGV